MVKVYFCVIFVASRSRVTGQGCAGFGMQLPGWHTKGEPAEGHGAGVYQLLFRPQEPHSVRGWWCDVTQFGGGGTKMPALNTCFGLSLVSVAWRNLQFTSLFFGGRVAKVMATRPKLIK